MLYLLTATGARPEAWAICERLMAAQDYTGPVRWIIVDDGPCAQTVTFDRPGWDLVVVSPQPLWQPGQNTQARNLLAGLDHVPPGADLVIIEDDDYYSPDWLSIVCEKLKQAELVGECQARYYNVRTGKSHQMSNKAHASLCSTAMRGAAIGTFRDVCRNAKQFIDIELWKRHPSKYLFTGKSVTGIKGLPGRDGIGTGHKENFGKPGVELKQWIGADAYLYFPKKKRALVIGSGDRVAAELRKVNRSDFDVVIGVNQAAIEFGPVDYHVSLHGAEYAKKKAGLMVTHKKCAGSDIITDYAFRKDGPSGSSGLYAVKFALVDLDCDEVVLAGVGMDFAPHFNDNEIWKPAGFRAAWIEALPIMRGKVTSLGGWTAEILNGHSP